MKRDISKECEEVLETLNAVIHFDCLGSDGILYSNGLKPRADGIKTLAKYGYVEIVGELHDFVEAKPLKEVK